MEVDVARRISSLILELVDKSNGYMGYAERASLYAAYENLHARLEDQINKFDPENEEIGINNFDPAYAIAQLKSTRLHTLYNLGFGDFSDVKIGEDGDNAYHYARMVNSLFT